MVFKKINKFIFPLILFIVFFSCSRSSPQKTLLPDFFEGYVNIKVYTDESSSINTISFNKEETFGSSENIFIYNASIVGIDNKSKVYVNTDKTIHVFKNNGSYITGIGNEGRGPGEFQVINNMKLRNGELYVYDANLSRVSIFNTDTFELKKVINIPTINGLRGLGEFGVIDDEYLIVGMPENQQSANSAISKRFMHYFLIDKTGYANETALKITDITDYYEVTNVRGTSYPPIPFDRTTLFSLSASGKMYFAWTDKIAIKILDSKGNYQKAVFYPYQNVQIESDSDFPGFYKVLDLISDTKKILGNRLPDTHPAVSQFFVDDEERLWLSTIVDIEGVYEWWVLKETGDLITRFKWPRNEPIEAVKNGYMYTLETEENTGLQQVVKYQIEIEEV